jgi:TPR repeat protein
MLRNSKVLLLAIALTLPLVGLCSVPQMNVAPIIDEKTEAVAQFNTAINYLHKQDPEAAVGWFRKAAENGLAVAQYNLAVAFDLGLGVEHDIKEAVFWYRKAAVQDDPDAQAMLAACLHNGDGIKQDFKEAARWFKRAANLGSADAQYQIALYYIEGRSVPKDYVQAYIFLSLAAQQGDSGSRELKSALSEKMTRDQIAKAEHLLTETPVNSGWN